ncbi:MAG: isochorismatase family protein [Alphaproteobacteria bacterium]|nr:isochorismatase family protein [Alphaproteobacteria bacterium]
MTERVWDKFLTHRDKAVLAATGYGAFGGFGKRPAILVVDVNYAFAGDRPEPILESVKRWRNSCGESAWPAIAAIKRIIAAGRAKGLPVIYSTSISRTDRWDDGGWAWKNTRSGEAPPRVNTDIDPDDIVAEIAPMPRDLMIRKQKPSAFYGSNLASYLVLLGADSVIVTGTTTSGCVRATVIDAFSLNYRIAIAEDGCFDRTEASHAINLFDMHAKYADVVASDEILTYIATLPAGMFDLPSGRGAKG